MFKNIRVVLLAAAVMLISALTMGGSVTTAKPPKTESRDDMYKQAELFADAVSAVRAGYVDEVESKKLIYGALSGMLSSLDDFSSFLDQDEYKEIMVEAKGEFAGLGVEITLKDGIITVIAPISGAPAESAGIKSGDRIVKIDGKTTKDMTLGEAVKKMRGSAGTTMTLTIWREKGDKVLEIPIRRAIVRIDSIKDAYLIEDKTGYIKLIEFQERTGRALEENLKKLERDGMDSLILDLRSNPGGLLDAAVEVSEKFLPKDEIIVSTKSRIPEQNVIYRSKGQPAHPDYPMIILVDEGSASASEIVAGALKDNRRAIILGTKTFGKGSVQTVIPLEDGSALRLTTAAYFTPNGYSIRKQGIIPDVVVERTEQKDSKKSSDDIFEKIDDGKPLRGEISAAKKKELIKDDNQLERAIESLKAIKVYRSGKQS